MRHTATVALLVAAVAFAPACSQAPEIANREPRIQLNVRSSDWRTVDVEGLTAGDLAYLERATLTRDEWAAILRVEVATTERPLAELPPVLGVTAVSDGVLRFTPQFPSRPRSTVRRRLRSIVAPIDTKRFRALPANTQYDPRGAGSRPRGVDACCRGLPYGARSPGEPPEAVHRVFRTDELQ